MKFLITYIQYYKNFTISNSNLAQIINYYWLQGVINSGARILLNFNPNQAPINSAYAMEIQILSNNFTFQEIEYFGIKCWEAISK